MANSKITGGVASAGTSLLTVYLLVEPTPGTDVGRVVGWGMLVGLLVFAALPLVVPHRRLTQLGLWPMLPAVAIAAIGILVLLYPDAQNVAHPLVALPVLYAASQP